MAVPSRRTEGAGGPSMSARLSIVVPVLDEGAALHGFLEHLQPLRARGHELICVDGGSRDGCVRGVEPLVDRLLETGPGRARQMNAGAAVAAGEVLLFLHADTRLPPGADRLVAAAVGGGHPWGRFDVRLSGSQWPLRWIERAMSLRSRLSGIATGDQALFVRRDVFDRVGGYADIALMEDLDLCRRLRRLAPPACLRQRVITSSRRWERDGILRTILLMWALRLAWSVGVPPRRLARIYYPAREFP